MNMQVSSGVQAPPPCKTLADIGLPHVMMRDILLKTMFRMNLETVTEMERTLAVPNRVVQDLIDDARAQGLVEALGTLHANSGGEMGYRLSDAGKARALDALGQSEYYGTMPVPLNAYARQMKRQSVRDIRMTRQQLTDAMGHLILPDELLDHLGPAVGSGRSILMYGPPGNGKSTRSTSRARWNIPAR